MHIAAVVSLLFNIVLLIHAVIVLVSFACA